MKSILESIITLPRSQKKIISSTFDLLLCNISIWFSFSLVSGKFITFEELNINLVIISVILAISIFWKLGLYDTILRFADRYIISTIALAICAYGVLFFIIIFIYNPQGVPKSIVVIQPLLLFVGVLGSRFGIKYILTIDHKNNQIPNKKNILIYGAGESGRQLALNAGNSLDFNVVGFIDDNEELDGKILSNYKVYHSSKIDNVIRSKKIEFIFLAIPSISITNKKRIIERLIDYKLVIKKLPTIKEIVDGTVNISHVKNLDLEDILDRDEVEPDINLLNQNIKDKIVMVTGAGGSIGSELCRQIMNFNPKKLLLLEFNEYSLYKIDEELNKYHDKSKIIPLLINVQNQKKLEIILENFKVNTIYHAAAYKHVPLVELNVCEAIKNNVFSSLSIIKASVNKKISNLVLISSDKAVRPINIMGATKRLSEICLQGICGNKKNVLTNAAIVRFGNVLESSGSVVPKFKDQIKNGGPVTLTHPEVTRYFMSVTEAAQLVIQAGSMGKNSEVFVLDMGKSVKILDLINKMIMISGLSVKDKCNPNGDIAIEMTGLRPGEKLYEELLIGNNPQSTSHPKIMKINEDFIPFHELETYLDHLERMLENNEIENIKNLFKALDIYYSKEQIIDSMYVQQLINKN